MVGWQIRRYVGGTKGLRVSLGTWGFRERLIGEITGGVWERGWKDDQPSGQAVEYSVIEVQTTPTSEWKAICSILL